MKQYQFENKDLEKVQQILKDIKEPVRVISKINRKKDGYTLTIEGSDKDLRLYIEQLNSFGIFM